MADRLQVNLGGKMCIRDRFHPVDTLCRYRHHLSIATARQTHESKNKIHPKAAHSPQSVGRVYGTGLGLSLIHI